MRLSSLIAEERRKIFDLTCVLTPIEGVNYLEVATAKTLAICGTMEENVLL